jgi:hypothetical protein
VSSRTTKAARELLARIQAADPSRTYRLEPDDDGIAIMRRYRPRGEWHYVCHVDEVTERQGKLYARPAGRADELLAPAT